MKKLAVKLTIISTVWAMVLLPSLSMAQNPFGLGDDTTTSRDIYGFDSRREAKTYDYDGYSKAVLTQIAKESFDGSTVYSWTHEQNLKNQYKTKVDPSVRFRNQPAVGNCTGFLIAPDIIVTAGHCISSDAHQITNGVVDFHESKYDEYGQFDYADWNWVFDYTSDIPMTKRTQQGDKEYYTATIPTYNQYTVKKILTSKLDWDNLVDYAVIQLDRPTSREPFRFRTGDKITKGDDLAMIGSPSGLPLKLSDGAEVTMNSGVNWFGTNLDAFGGNSGGPVYNKAGYGWIEGILVRGRIDKGAKGFYLDKDCNCVKETKYENVDATSILDDWGIPVDLKSTEVQRITGIPVDLKVKAVYSNMKYAIVNNSQTRFDDWLIYSWMYTQDTSALIQSGLNGADPVGVLALKNKRTDMFRSFVDNGMDCGLVLPDGKTMLYHTIDQKNMQALEYVLQEGYNLENKDAKGKTAIFWAIDAYNTDALKILLENGASTSARNNSGDRPIHTAIRAGSISMVRMLVENGASIYGTSSEGYDAIKLAKKTKRKYIKKYLKKVKKGKA